MSEKSLEVEESRAAGPLTMPFVSRILEELASMPLLLRLLSTGKVLGSEPMPFCLATLRFPDPLFTS